MKMKNLTLLIALYAMFAVCWISAIPAFCAPLHLTGINSEVCFPGVSSGPKDHVYVVWEDREAAEPEDANTNIYFKRSVDGGSTFEQTVLIEDDNTPLLSVNNPKIVVDSSGTIYIVYTKHDMENRVLSLLVSKSDDNGESFTKQTVDTMETSAVQGMAFPGADIAISQNQIFYIWSSLYKVYLAKSRDGDKFDILEVDHAGSEDRLPDRVLTRLPSLTVDSNQNVYTVWFEAHLSEDTVIPNYDIYTAKLENGQEQFSTCKAIAQNVGEAPRRPSIVANSSGGVYIAWSTITSGGIMKIISNDGGVSYSDPISTPFGIDTSHFQFETILDENGVMHCLGVSWTGDIALYYSNSLDLGETFENSSKITSYDVEEAEMHWNQDKELAYMVWMRRDPESTESAALYFATSLDRDEDTEPGTTNPDQLNSSDGGGGGCFIHGMLGS